jgi:galactokinase
VYSGIPRKLAESEYNERQASCQKAVDVLHTVDPGIAALRDASPGILEGVKDRMDPRVYKRARHVISEQTRVFDLIGAMKEQDLETVGKILLEGHRSLDEDYEVSLPLLNQMVDTLYEESGVIGCRLTGAGFGGSLVCLIDEGGCDVEKTTKRFLKKFKDKTPEPVQIWELTTVDGAAFQADFED